MSRIGIEDVASMVLFAKVVQLRSFTAAARELGMAKSAASKRVAALERRLGVRLLTRTTRQLALTDEGLRFYPQCAAIAVAMEGAEAAIEGARDLPRGRLRVNAPTAFARMHLAAPIARFLAIYPDIELELTADDRFVDVIEGGYDVVIRITQLASSSLVARKLSADRIVICGSPSYLDARGRPSRPEELVDHECMIYTLVPREVGWRFGGKAGVALPVRGPLSTNSGDFLKQAAIEGVGLAVVPLFLIARDIADGKLELVLEDVCRNEVGIYAVFPGRKQMPARTRVFLQHLGKHFASPRWRTAICEGR